MVDKIYTKKCEMVYSCIPEDGSPIRYNRLHEKITEELQSQNEIKKTMSKSTLSDCLKKIININLVEKKKLKGIRGNPVEYRRNKKYDFYDEDERRVNPENVEESQYLMISMELSNIIKNLIKELYLYSKDNDEIVYKKRYSMYLSVDILPRLMKLLNYVENENKMNDDVYRCLFGDHDFSMREKSYENLYVTKLNNMIVNSSSWKSKANLQSKLEKMSNIEIMLEYKYKDEYGYQDIEKILPH
ncbi:hypothetical protein [Methanococcoides alaskense]|uniref:DNA-binding transcriptional regulator GbsR (MarR family) n=1 Tax=Methanococcoides alaskense TaxID=325778 RepID=A0AA90Z928_9EURY|nr:hypothetical protein [Methanococcoides alaskense]MDA0524222.1 hypothetical protein [Methanococcoides alaskense]MDR6223655.1 DNA-binding transcriptional regulator GbsR (MarR family) [Methanococcoides alaskense]